jgi:hypothetical protein
VENRGAWILGALGLGFVALLLYWMGKTLDTKAPIRIDRGVGSAVAEPTPLPPEELARREEESQRALVVRQSGALASQAAAQTFAPGEVARARCTFTGASPVHRDETSAYWRLEYSCADRERPDALPNLTSVSVRLWKEGTRWTLTP